MESVIELVDDIDLLGVVAVPHQTHVNQAANPLTELDWRGYQPTALNVPRSFFDYVMQ